MTTRRAAAPPDAVATCAGTMVDSRASYALQTQRAERMTPEHRAVRSRLVQLGHDPAAADLRARRLIAARRWSRRAQQAARRAARASSSVR